jgi:hypothetical protein
VSIRTAKAVKLGKRRRKVDVASRTFNVKAGRSATVRLRPSAVGRRLLRRVNRVKVRVIAKSKGGKVARRTVVLRG